MFTDLFRTGIDEKVTEAGDQLAGVIGKRNVDKLGDIVMTSFGYSDSETCLCCPCLPASQVTIFNVLLQLSKFITFVSGNIMMLIRK